MLLHIKIKPNSKTNEITRETDGTLKVKIKAPPVDGKANKYLVEYLSHVLKIPKSKITILKGTTNQFKTLEIEGEEKVVMGKLGI